MIVMPELDPGLCDGCGLCVVACHGGAIVQEEGKIKITETEKCDFCCVCEMVCPAFAIKCPYIITPGDC